jgi:hypothetical protein
VAAEAVLVVLLMVVMLALADLLWVILLLEVAGAVLIELTEHIQQQQQLLLVEEVEVLLTNLTLLVEDHKDLENQHNPTLAAEAAVDGIMVVELEKAVLEVLVLLLSVTPSNL